MASDKPKKRFYKRWWFWVIVVVIVIIIAIGSSGGGDNSNSSSSTTTTNSSSSTSTSGIDKINNTNFSDTSGQQTTTVSKAEIKDVSDQGLTDDNGNDIKYALVINMSVKNDANDQATAYPAQGHIVLPDGTQISGAEGLDSSLDSAFKEGDIEKGAIVKGDVYFPLKDSQAKSIKNAQFKFQVMCGDENVTEKNYTVNLNFK
ncbi:hypothetical protein OYT88_04770 [Sporolactobacillus sp. CQH2019]|uniref:DUF4352 domain-containing protein n=1 Tax=Sporolactobacillus sp. CQH2019 TaxID=3023512 RepID=UPI0023683843|nr:DUF4352 domain-containing protein [Sporolactobacillus sp. CQH2019]MDD9147861.1 hypothetical protein [Sporolactobacillus sp. CQH2019]